MGKIVFWLVILFLALLVVRLYNHHQLQKREAAKRARESSDRTPEAMVQCRRCGVFLPRSDASSSPPGFVCANGCEQRKNP